MPLPMRPEELPEAPSAPWRAASALTMGAVGLLCKGFLSGFSRVETHGMEAFLELLDAREDVSRRERGLITGMQHTPWRRGLSDTRQYRTTSPCRFAPISRRSDKYGASNSHRM
jgi:hypothetical protein